MKFESTGSVVTKSEAWCRAWLRDEYGVNFTAIPHKDEHERFFNTLVMPDIVRVFPEATSLVSWLYLYDQDRNPKGSDSWRSDGICWYKRTDEGTVYAIGIAVQAFAAGVPYVQLLVLHELAHILSSYDDESRGSQFNATLDIMIELFNLKVGAEIKNDYQHISTESSDSLPADYEPIAPADAMAAWRDMESDSSRAARERMPASRAGARRYNHEGTISAL